MLVTDLNHPLREQYEALKPYANGVLAPRIGYYKILSTDIRDYGDMNVPIAKALWSPTADAIEGGLPVQIQLFSLSQKYSHGPINELKKGLTGKIIEVTSTTLIEGGKSAMRYGVNWRIPGMLSSDPFYLFGPGTLGDSQAMYIQSFSDSDAANMQNVEEDIQQDAAYDAHGLEFDESGFQEPDYYDDYDHQDKDNNDQNNPQIN